MVSLSPCYFAIRSGLTICFLIILFIFLYTRPSHKVNASTLCFDLCEKLYTVLSPGLKWCDKNPFLSGYDKQIVTEFEKKWYAWSQTQFIRTFNFLKKYAQSAGKTPGEFPQIVYPTAEPLFCPYNNNSMKRYGNSRNSGKYLCGLETLSHDDTCTVYSLGSNNNFEFEESILSETRCTVHTFDCTSSPPQKKNVRLHYHEICLGEYSPLQNYIYPKTEKVNHNRSEPQRTYLKFDQILKMKNHTRLDVLKMDIEGGEYSVFTDILGNFSRSDLPYQISFESHFWNHDIYHAILHISLFSQLWRSGYRLLQHELNEGDQSCTEWTFIRMFC
jgi:hypothetical protein